MIFPRAVLLRAWPSTVVTRRILRGPQSTNGTSSSKSILPNRSFSITHFYPINSTNRNARSSHEFPTSTMAKTTRKDSALKAGTDFKYHQIPPCLIPHGWTNDPRELEICLGLDLHKEYTSFPQKISPVLASTGEADSGCWGHLLCEGSDVFDPDFYLVISDQVLRLETKIELLPLLMLMKEQADNKVKGENGETPLGLKSLLEHPGLAWDRLEQDEWTEICTQATS